MALNEKKYGRIHGKDGSDKDAIKAMFDNNMQSIIVDFPENYPELSAIIYYIGQLEEELDYLRSVINSKEDILKI